MLLNIKSQLARFLKRPELAIKLEEQKIITSWQDTITSINKSAQDKSQALYIKKDGELVVRVVDHLWLQEMTFYKEDIKQALNLKLSAEQNKKEETIKSIRFVT